MDDVWDVIILFLIAAIVGGLMFVGASTFFKKSVQKGLDTNTPSSRPVAEAQTRQAEQTRRDQERLLRDQRRAQEQMQRDTQRKIKDLQRK